MRQLLNKAVWFTIICLSGFQLSAQNEAGFNNPYEVIYNHLDYLQDDNFFPELSARSFPADLDSLERIRSAQLMKRIYDGKGLYVHVSRISKDSMYQDSIAEDFIYFPFPEVLPDVYVEKIDDKWMYSDLTVDIIPDLYQDVYPFGLHRVIDMLPAKQGMRYFGLYGWQWIALLVFGLILVVGYYILSRVLNISLKLMTRKLTFLQKDQIDLIKRIDGLIVLAFLSSLVSYMLPVIRLPIKMSFFLLKINEVLFTVFVVLIVLTLVNILKAYLKEAALATETKLDEQLLPIVIKMIKIIVVIAGVFNVLHILNVNVTALIAGISIGGLALALAAQDTVKNLIGSMMIFFDKPFQIGDYIIAGSNEGSVVEVGFRSTRIKKVDTSIISIPNGILVNEYLTNLGVRNMRVLNTTIGLMYNSKSEDIKSFISDLKEYVSKHPRIWQESKYVLLKELGPSSIDIMLRVYIETTDYADELAVKEEIIFNVISIAEKNNVAFAFPSSSVYIEQMPTQNNG
ncbi:MAG: mechanosensitive ion channel family protein [Saprospiraceae bacterium]|nr:mechanosensitive ion channel family protein [Saprospiraceae bacterium]